MASTTRDVATQDETEAYQFLVFPPARPAPWARGDLAFVSLKSDKSTGLARVLADAGPGDERVPVEYAEGGSASVRQARMTRVRQGSSNTAHP
jgi:hypothetical protein